jgi:SAM-dependent methyltransferase
MAGRSTGMAARPRTRLTRPTLSDDEVERVRRERREPRPTQWDYRHLEGLRRGLLEAFRTVPDTTGPVLDLYCGTKPYLELMPWRPVVGVDVDRHFARADVIADLPLPFRDGSFRIAVCTQALHLVDDPIRTVEELRRVLAPSGRLIVTVPHLFLAEGAFERHWSIDDVRTLFAGWDDLTIRGIDGPGAAAAFVLGRVAMLAARRSSLVRVTLPVIALVLNTVAATVDRLLAPVASRWPHSLIVRATRPV